MAIADWLLPSASVRRDAESLTECKVVFYTDGEVNVDRLTLFREPEEEEQARALSAWPRRRGVSSGKNGSAPRIL